METKVWVSHEGIWEPATISAGDAPDSVECVCCLEGGVEVKVARKEVLLREELFGDGAPNLTTLRWAHAPPYRRARMQPYQRLGR